MISLPEFSRIWQQSIDVLEYQSPEVFRRHIVGARWRSAFRFVMTGAIITSLIETVDALINGANPVRSFLLAVIGAPIGFALFTLGVFWVARMFRQRVRLRDITYGFALFYVPISILSTVAQAFAGFLPTFLGGIVTAVVVLGVAWLELRLAYAVMRGLAEFKKPWQLWLALVLGALLGLILNALNIFGDVGFNSD